jgi:hypothetical protein
MTDLYLYCIRQKSSRPVLGTGIDGRSKIVVLSYKDIEAIASPINKRFFNLKEVARRAKDDVSWIIRNADKHERVIERAMRDGPVIPMKFGTIMKSRSNLESVLRDDYQKFIQILKRLKAKDEWGVKVYVQEDRLKDRLEKNNKTIRSQVKKKAGLPRGADYFHQLEIDEKIDALLKKEIHTQVKHFFRVLQSEADSSRSNKVLAKEFTGKKEPMILNSAYLVKANKSDGFKKSVKKLQRRYPEYIFDRTGPWPPYNFIT